MEQAIKIAIENGYSDTKWCNAFDVYEYDGNYCHQAVLLDPLFWQCLGKGLSWEETIQNDGPGEQPGWVYEWSKLIYHLADGGDINGFFTKLLK